MYRAHVEPPQLEGMPSQSSGELPSDSPYYGTMLKIEFMGGVKARVHREVINKHPDLAARFHELPPNEPLKLLDVPGRVGHTIVHYLFTGTYQALPVPPGDVAETPKGMLVETLQVYFEAVNLGLEDLGSLAGAVITEQCQGMSFASLIKVLDDEFDTLTGHETWLIKYLADRATMDSEQVTEEDIQKFRTALGDQCGVIDILLEGIMKLKFRLQSSQAMAV
ncbi:uncharacterized protein NECHADRAFT_78044 [Fusarium vanettenii 77-13-4]|uniref:BTB domain-containing protein n=1 Tax=Fusarium vanettenii (strain ATCC MYA-4622 / CBS 123669 / FGSC 9596 / NRRL 45880 / 77-13-4) TaxID=660122 RepID=C7YMY8_FUSV7|nr:uncharacterized protein NECHADRAFT_78044 [Fusarium vanettenii 77-13-4]EEU47530.1 hypothetical protein NECHADRAFT_78044 [Fusarium vanettenii 77-13-4]